MSRIIIGVDCGVRGCGVGVFYSAPGEAGGHLMRAAYIKNPMRHGNGANSALALASAVYNEICGHYMPKTGTEIRTILAIETMKFYSADQQKGAQSDIGAVQLVAGAVTGFLRPDEVVSYLPAEWKGSIDGDVCTKRIIERLTPLELSRVELTSETLDHNTYDGVGIGLKYLGRFEPRRVYARD